MCMTNFANYYSKFVFQGTKVIEVIVFDISKTGDVYLSSDSFKSMTNLRYLHISDKMQLPDEGKRYNVHFLQGLEWLSDKLRHLTRVLAIDLLC